MRTQSYVNLSNSGLVWRTVFAVGEATIANDRRTIALPESSGRFLYAELFFVVANARIEPGVDQISQ